MKKAIIILWTVTCLCSCQFIRHKYHRGTVAEVAGQRLSDVDLYEITKVAVTPEDSAALAEAYIRQWATDILVYEKAKDRASDQLERLVEDYRRQLYIHEYEQNLVNRHPIDISDDEIRAYYENHASAYTLHESLIKGILLVLPNGTPKQTTLRKWLEHPGQKEMEKIEKYAYQYARGYEFFTDTWHTANQLLLQLPLTPDELHQRMREASIIEVSDSLNTYWLRVTDRALRGDMMPMDYAAPEIRKTLLAQKQAAYLKQKHNELYDDAVKFKKIRFEEL